MSPPKGPDLLGRMPGDPFYGSDPGSEQRAKADPVVGQLVQRVAALEKNHRRAATQQAGIGNFRCIGGWRGTGPSSPWTQTSGASYEDFGGNDFTHVVLTKKYADTGLLVLMWVAGYLDPGTGTSFEVGMLIDVTDHGPRVFRINPTLTHRDFSTYLTAGGHAADDFEMQIRIRRTSGSGTFKVDDQDSIGFVVFEYPTIAALFTAS